jgi:hypothetical protein
VIFEAEVFFEIHITVDLTTSGGGTNRGIRVGVITAERETETIKRRRRIGEGCRAGISKGTANRWLRRIRGWAWFTELILYFRTVWYGN